MVTPGDALDAGTRHLLDGRVREAIECLQRARPTHAMHHNLAVALRTHGDIATALVHANHALVESPRCAPTVALVGSLLNLGGDRAGALSMFRTALELDPQHDVSRYCLAITLATGGDREGAITELRRVSIDGSRLPDNVRARARAQVNDLLASERMLEPDLCSIPLVTEIVGVTPREARPDVAMPATVAGRQIDLASARSIVAGATRIVALTGAGISSASGLATRKELWRRHDRDDAVSIAQFRRDPQPLWTVIRDFLDRPLVPNAAHHALADLGCEIITQNVEGLHQAAGSSTVLELHGTLLDTRCEQCGARSGLSCVDAIAFGDIPLCTCGGALRPDVVLFGEWVDRTLLERAAAMCAGCDLLLVIGTAADVAPASDLPLLAIDRGATVVEIKRTASRLVRAGALHLAGVAEAVLPQLVGDR